MIKRTILITWLLLIYSINFALEFSLIDQELYLGLRYNARNYQSNTKSELLNLNKNYKDLRYYLSFLLEHNENYSFFGRYKVKYLQEDTEENRQRNSTDNYESIFDEGYISFSPFNNLFVDVGKKDIAWGSAYAWNLINVFDTQNRFIKEDNDYANIYLIEYFANEKITFSFAGGIDNKHYAFKYYHGFDQFNYDILLFHNVQSGLGMNFSMIASQALELHAEAVLQRGIQNYYPQKIIDTVYQWQQSKDNNQLYSQFLLGGQYTTNNNINIIFEYFYNELGLSDSEYNTLQQGIDFALLNNNYLNPAPSREFIFGVHTNYQFARLRQHYLFMRLNKNDVINKMDIVLASYYSIDGTDLLFLPDLSYRFRDNMTFQLKIFIPVGEKNSEFRRQYNYYGLFTSSYIF